MAFYTLDLQFYQKKMGKKKKGDDSLLRKKNRRKAKQCWYNDICRWEKDSFSSEVEITRGIVWIKILKKKILKEN